MHRSPAFIALAVVAALAPCGPTAAQDAGVEKNDHAWQPPVYSLKGTTDSSVATVNPLHTVPCSGCGTPQPPPTQPQPTAARWAFYPFYGPVALAGGVTDWMMSRGCLKRSDNTLTEDSQCTGTPPKEICVVDSLGYGCCPTDYEVLGLAVPQSQYATTRTYGSRYWQCS